MVGSVPGTKDEPTAPHDEGLDLNQVVSYNLRAGRELRGWTQVDLAAQLERFLGTRPTQATISALERAWDGDRRREFDVQEIAIYAAALDLPIVWFFLPPPGDRRPIQGLDRPVQELYLLLLGRHDQLDPVYETPTRARHHRPNSSRAPRRKDHWIAQLQPRVELPAAPQGPSPRASRRTR